MIKGIGNVLFSTEWVRSSGCFREISGASANFYFKRGSFRLLPLALTPPVCVSIQNVTACASNTSTCFRNVDVVPVHSETFRIGTRRRVGSFTRFSLFFSACRITHNNNSNTIWRVSVLSGVELPPHSGELKHALTQAGGPSQSQLSRLKSSRHHISMEHRLRRKHLLLNPNTNTRKGKKEKERKEEQDPRT